MTAKEKALALAAAAADQQGFDVRVLDLHTVASFTDFFVMVSASSDRHARTLADAVREAGRALGTQALGSEGEEQARWILIDYGDVIVHVFQSEVREYYALERLWGEADRVELPRAVEASR